MRAYELKHLSDPDLLRALTVLVARERTTTAELLAHVAEVDARKLYLPAGYPSMFVYCVESLHLSEDSAYRRIRAARVCRQFPAVFAGLADGRLNLSAVGLLAPYLTRGNAEGLLKAAQLKTRSEIEELLARRFPRSELLPMVENLPGSCPGSDGRPVAGALDQTEEVPLNSGNLLVPERVESPSRVVTESCEVALAPAPAGSPRSRLAPIAPERFALHVTIGADTHEKLRHAQVLLSHKLPSGDLARVLDLALDALVEKLEKRKFAKTDTPRPRRHRTSATNPRHIPAHVKRAVWQRDGGRCTFVGDTGRRCNARRFLEFDHVEPVARGGTATVTGLRLRCRAHNRLEAERAFGADFMRAKQEMAQQARDVMSCLRTRISS